MGRTSREKGIENNRVVILRVGMQEQRRAGQRDAGGQALCHPQWGRVAQKRDSPQRGKGRTVFTQSAPHPDELMDIHTQPDRCTCLSVCLEARQGKDRRGPVDLQGAPAQPGLSSRV